MNPRWSIVSLIFFLLIALIGSLLRASSYIDIPLVYEHLKHAHSHVAFQGWVYTIMFLVLTDSFVPSNEIKKGRFNLLFVMSVTGVACILIAFALRGYGFYSIVFSTIFQILSYVFIYSFIKSTKGQNYGISMVFVKTGLFFGILSTVMPIAIGIVSAKGMKGSEIYFSFLYTFLHLQYNGWFLFVIIGVLYKVLRDRKQNYDIKYSRYFYVLYTLSVLPGIGQSLLGMSFANIARWPAYFASFLQVLALYYFYKSIVHLSISALGKSFLFKLTSLIFLISFFIKEGLQILSVLPVFHSFAFSNKLTILAYLHLSMIGVISFFYLSCIILKRWAPRSWYTTTGIIFLFLGYIITEGILVSGALSIFYDQSIILGGSLMMVGGLIFLIAGMTFYPKFSST